jgi:hypothetical protein
MDALIEHFKDCRLGPVSRYLIWDSLPV